MQEYPSEPILRATQFLHIPSTLRSSRRLEGVAKILRRSLVLTAFEHNGTVSASQRERLSRVAQAMEDACAKSWRCPRRCRYEPPAWKTSSRRQLSDVLRTLVRANGGWVPLSELACVAPQYSARIGELRRLGYAVENRVTHDGHEFKSSYYRLRDPLLASLIPETTTAQENVRSA